MLSRMGSTVFSWSPWVKSSSCGPQEKDLLPPTLAGMEKPSSRSFSHQVSRSARTRLLHYTGPVSPMCRFPSLHSFSLEPWRKQLQHPQWLRVLPVFTSSWTVTEVCLNCQAGHCSLLTLDLQVGYKDMENWEKAMGRKRNPSSQSG